MEATSTYMLNTTTKIWTCASFWYSSILKLNERATSETYSHRIAKTLPFPSLTLCPQKFDYSDSDVLQDSSDAYDPDFGNWGSGFQEVEHDPWFLNHVKDFKHTFESRFVVLSTVCHAEWLISTERGGSSIARFWRQEFGEFPWLVGRYCCYLLPKQGGGTPQILVFKTLRITSRPTLYVFRAGISPREIWMTRQCSSRNVFPFPSSWGLWSALLTIHLDFREFDGEERWGNYKYSGSHL